MALSGSPKATSVSPAKLARHDRQESYLPRYDGSALEVVTSSPPPVLTGGRNLLPAARSGGTILLVEDEEQVHNVVQEALEDLGYRVLTTTNAAEAIALLEARGRAGVDSAVHG